MRPFRRRIITWFKNNRIQKVKTKIALVTLPCAVCEVQVPMLVHVVKVVIQLFEVDDIILIVVVYQ